VKASKRYSLDRSYSIWFQTAQHTKKRAKSEQQYEEGLQSIGTFNSVQGFWQYWNAIDLKKLPNFCTLSVFKHPIKPMWEDPHNKEGGQWVIRCGDRHQTSDFFTKLALSLIGGYFDCHEDLCGVVLSMKPKFNSLSLWNCQVEPDLVDVVEDELRNLFEVESSDSKLVIEYKEHGGAMLSNAMKRHEASPAEVPVDALKVTANVSVLSQPAVSLAPQWLRTSRPPAATASVTATSVVSSSAAPVITAASKEAQSAPRLIVAAKAESSSGSKLKATAAPFTYSGNSGYSGYSSTGLEYQNVQTTVANGSQYTNGNYGQYYSDNYTFYNSGEYVTADYRCLGIASPTCTERVSYE